MFEPQRKHRVVVGVRKDLESARHELFRRVDELDGIRKQGLFIGDHLEFDPVGFEGLASQFSGEDGFARGETSCGIGQHQDVVIQQHPEERRPARGAMPTHCHGGELGAGRSKRSPETLLTRRSPGAHDEPRGEGHPVDHQRIRVVRS